MKIITAGRTDLQDFFKLSGILGHYKHTHTPFLAFVSSQTLEPHTQRELDDAERGPTDHGAICTSINSIQTTRR